MKVHIKRANDQTPVDGNAFIVAGNGVFLKKENDWIKAVVPVNAIDGLLHQETTAELLLPRITSTTFAKAVLFFKEVYERLGVESAVLLHYNKETGHYAITVPENQEATPVHVKYNAQERLPGYRCVGTLHSHCAMSAFHSGTDTHDESAHDGIHITIGRLDAFPRFGMDAEFVVNGTRFKLPHEHIIRVQHHEPNLARKALGVLLGKPEPLYSIPFGILRNWTVPEEWIERVTRKEFELFEFPGLLGFFGTEDEDEGFDWDTFRQEMKGGG